jgi:hypothetical protein
MPTCRILCLVPAGWQTWIDRNCSAPLCFGLASWVTISWSLECQDSHESCCIHWDSEKDTGVGNKEVTADPASAGSRQQWNWMQLAKATHSCTEGKQWNVFQLTRMWTDANSPYSCSRHTHACTPPLHKVRCRIRKGSPEVSELKKTHKVKTECLTVLSDPKKYGRATNLMQF